jgi:hypothetical protein
MGMVLAELVEDRPQFGDHGIIGAASDINHRR